MRGRIFSPDGSSSRYPDGKSRSPGVYPCVAACCMAEGRMPLMACPNGMNSAGASSPNGNGRSLFAGRAARVLPRRDAELPKGQREGERAEVGRLALAACLTVPVGMALIPLVPNLAIRWIAISIAAITLIALVAGWRYQHAPGHPCGSYAGLLCRTIWI